jgi:hypothetical protein
MSLFLGIVLGVVVWFLVGLVAGIAFMRGAHGRAE